MNKKTLLAIFAAALTVAPLVTSAAAANLQGIIGGLKDSLLGIGVSLSIIGFMVAGIMYVTSAANPKNMETAKQAFIAAVIGIVIIILASNACPFVNGLFGNQGTCPP